MVCAGSGIPALCIITPKKTIDQPYCSIKESIRSSVGKIRQFYCSVLRYERTQFVYRGLPLLTELPRSFILGN